MSRKQWIAAWSLISFSVHPPVLSLGAPHPVDTGTRLQAGNWDVSLEKLTPSSTFQYKQPALSKAVCQLWKAHGKQAQAGASRGAGETLTKQHLQPQASHWNPQTISKMVQKHIPDLTTDPILQTCPQLNKANLCRGFFSLIEWPFFSCNCPGGISKFCIDKRFNRLLKRKNRSSVLDKPTWGWNVWDVFFFLYMFSPFFYILKLLSDVWTLRFASSKLLILSVPYSHHMYSVEVSPISFSLAFCPFSLKKNQNTTPHTVVLEKPSTVFLKYVHLSIFQVTSFLVEKSSSINISLKHSSLHQGPNSALRSAHKTLLKGMAAQRRNPTETSGPRCFIYL